MALALLFASALDDAPHACSDRRRRVGLPFSSRSGPGILPMRAKNDALRGLSPDLTGAFRFIPCALADARPLAFRPPDGDFPSLRCHAGDFIKQFHGYFALLAYTPFVHDALWQSISPRLRSAMSSHGTGVIGTLGACRRIYGDTYATPQFPSCSCLYRTKSAAKAS